jgi:hypothetical protein
MADRKVYALLHIYDTSDWVGRRQYEASRDDVYSIAVSSGVYELMEKFVLMDVMSRTGMTDGNSSRQQLGPFFVLPEEMYLAGPPRGWECRPLSRLSAGTPSIYGAI